MPKTTPEQNKTLVLEAFDTLFNKRDYAAAEKFWSPQYIQHSAFSPTIPVSAAGPRTEIATADADRERVQRQSQPTLPRSNHPGVHSPRVLGQARH
jgi:hypothetical protein